MTAIRLNIGAGDTNLDGFAPIDRKLGSEAYPLAYEDGSIDEIRASHVLEHFPHGDVAAVLADWTAKLKPGGCLRIAVPDFAAIARAYVAGKPFPVQGVVMGGQTDADDYHRAIFDRASLTRLLVDAGLERIGPWKSELADCASLPVSLNLQGFKPSGTADTLENVVAVLSTARYGPMAPAGVIQAALAKLRIGYAWGHGAYWHEVLSELLEKNLQAEYILTLDYDTVASDQEVRELYRLARAVDADAICPLQMKRDGDRALAAVMRPDGTVSRDLTRDELAQPLLKIITGHFGLTLIKTAALRELPRPWMMPEPDKDGRWRSNIEGGAIPADVSFWKHWHAAGKSLYLAPRVPVGHSIDVILWPGAGLKPVYQSWESYRAGGISVEVPR
jgi:hypothetical protein